MEKYIKLLRPKTLLVGLAPITLALGIMLKENVEINYINFILTLVCIILLQMGSNVANDLYDGIRGVDTEERLGPKREASSGTTSHQTLKYLTLSLFAVAFFIGCFLSFITGYELFVLGILSMLVAYCYTGGPFPLAYIGLGEVLALLFFGPVAFLGTVYIQIKQCNLSMLPLSLVPGLFSSSLMALNNYRDIHTDKSAGKITLAVLLGENCGKLLTCIFFLGALIIFSFEVASYPGKLSKLIFILPYSLSIITLRGLIITKHGRELNKFLALISLTNFCFALTFLLNQVI